MKQSCCLKFVIFLIRWVIGPLIGIPIATLLFPFYRLNDAYTFLWFQGRHLSNPEEHRRKVTHVQDQVRAWNAGGRKRRMCTARPAWTSLTVHSLDKSNLSKIELAGLNCVVDVDEVNLTVTVEPGIMMGQLTTILNPRGWTIPVVPEFEVLTVGGVVCGAGLETTSTRYGMPADAAVEFELVLGSGDVVTCSREKNPDLFHSIAWSHGTIGFLTAVKFPLLPAKKYVRLEYHVADSLQEAQALLETQDHEFVEGITWGRDSKFVIMHGDMSDAVEIRQERGRVNHINRWYKPLFYKHVESFLRRRRGSQGGQGTVAIPHVEYIPLRDYYHRHTRGFFWCLPLLFPMITNRLILVLFGWLFPFVDFNVGRRLLQPFMTSTTYRFAGKILHVLQDFVLPMQHLRASLDFLHEETGVYPLWLCPCRVFRTRGMSHSQDPNADSELYIDIGIYGSVSKEAARGFNTVETLRKMEAFVIEHKGYQGTYADMLLTREQFRRMFDMGLYDEVRAKYECLDAFPDVYDKVSKEARKIEV